MLSIKVKNPSLEGLALILPHTSNPLGTPKGKTVDTRSDKMGQVSQLRMSKHSENFCLLINRRVFASLPPRQVAPLDEKEM